ncbi:uncharacterized protein TNCV_4356501 [Trichonephila clavipes]|nr:uncharacterized protein TNCV_4356501 [Trichonephila clavipes]
MPNEIKLADYKFNIPGKIDVLLGAEIFYELLRPGQIYCGDSRLLLQNTVFGYVVSGSVGDEVRDNNIHCGLIRDSDLNTTLRSFWELESIGVKNENCSSEEDVSFEMFKQRVHFKNGRYEVELPWKRDSNVLSDNFSLAKRRLGSLMRKMQRDKVLYSEYCKVLKNYLDVGIIEKKYGREKRTGTKSCCLILEREKFEQWCSRASFLRELQIPRYALQCDSVNCPECEIHTFFSDASIKAYGAVSYVRLRTFDKISVHLLASKSRVTPLKVLTLPRLELMGALLAARLAKEISRVLNEKISTTNYFWTDSTIALSWIQGPSNRWKVFVANRVKEIRSLTDKDSWRHCPGKDNPSDLLTRGISADSLINCEKWWKGPSFLQEGNTVPVSNNVLLSDESAYLEELKPTERKTLTVILDNNL